MPSGIAGATPEPEDERAAPGHAHPVRGEPGGALPDRALEPSLDPLAAARRTLARIWGYPEFRPGQDEIVAAILEGRDTLAIMPTGGGKSLCYQLPALIRPGLTVVVSPLIALMQDQVAGLRALGVEAAALSSAESPDEKAEIRAKLWDGTLRLLYLAPERLAVGDTQDMLDRVGVGLLAVDEAHCVAQWGHDFRPDYLEIGRLRRMLERPGRPLQIAAFTATADEATRAEILDKLFGDRREPAPAVFIRGFDRPNLKLAFEPKANPRQRILDYVRARPGQCGIVYCASRKGVERMAEALVAAGVPALPYHAGLDAAVRKRNQRAFTDGDGVVMAATVAFGMGVDKPDVRFVVHADLPKTVESYYQEIGRAGRDGLPADTLTLYGLEDIKLRRRQIDESEAPPQRKRADHARLSALLALAEAPRCRRQTLLAYFDERLAEPCGACDLCENPPERIDGTVLAQKALSAMVRTGERFGVEHLTAVLRGEATEAVAARGHDKLPTFGVGRDLSRAEWRSVFRQLYALGIVEVPIDGAGGWALAEPARAVLKGEATVELKKEKRPELEARPGGGAARTTRTALDTRDLDEADNALYRALKQKRLDLAREAGAPAYVIFTDRTLLEIARAKPTTMSALGRCHGVGEAKLKRFGKIVLEVIGKVA